MPESRPSSTDVSRSDLCGSFVSKFAHCLDPSSHTRYPEKIDAGPHHLRSVLKPRKMPSARSMAFRPSKQRTSSPPPCMSTLSASISDAAPHKKNCLCAPTTHAGSFRCRLHRLPPPPLTISSAKKCSSQLPCSRSKASINHQLKHARSLSASSFYRLDPRPSRLSKSVAKDPKPATPVQETSVAWGKISITICAEDGLESSKEMEISEASDCGAVSASSGRNTEGGQRSLVKVLSI